MGCWLQSKNRLFCLRDGITRDDPVLAVMPTAPTWFDNRVADGFSDPNIYVVDRPTPSPVPELGQEGRRLYVDVKKNKKPADPIAPKPHTIAAEAIYRVDGRQVRGADIIAALAPKPIAVAKGAPPPPPPSTDRPMTGIFTDAEAKAKADAEAKPKGK